MNELLDFADFVQSSTRAPDPKGHLISRRASGIEPKAIEWIWRGRIARGKHTAFAGEPGTNKSTLVCEITASVTTERGWPCNEGRPPRKGRVLILSAEDDAADTIVPRLIAAGADLDLVEIVDAVKDEKGKRSLNLAVDIDRLERALVKYGDVDLIAIDPISAYMGKTDSHNNSEVRGVLEPLQKMAERTGVAVVSVTHFAKQSGSNTTKALHRFMGSIAFTAAARMAFAVIEDRDNPIRRLLLHVKNNLAAPPQGLAFTVVQRIVEVIGGSAVHPYIAWEAQPVAMTANEAMAADAAGSSTARDSAQEFLQTVLTVGPLPQKTVKEEAEGAGFAWATVRRAKHCLGVKAEKEGMRGGWVWALPERPKVLNSTEGAQS